MIRAHLATFPPRKTIMLETVARMAPQVDRLFLVLNEYTEIPDELNGYNNVEAVIPEQDLKDVGKFLFAPDPDDVVFTIDDDITFPVDYVKNTLALADKVGLDRYTIGYHAHAWVFKKREDRFAWRNYMFFNKLNKAANVDILGTGTVCVLGRNMPPLAYMESSMRFVDIRFAQSQLDKGVQLLTLPRGAEYIKRNLPDDLRESSIFNTFTRKFTTSPRVETGNLIRARVRETGRPMVIE